MTSNEDRMDAEFRRRQEKRAIEAVVSAAEALNERAARRERILAEYGFDIGTREEANSQTGPYADPDNQFAVEAFLTMNDVKIVHLDVVLSLDVCEGCGLKVADFEPGGFEREDGQRGHFVCLGVFPDPTGSITCSNPDVEHPGFPCNHPPFDPYA